MRKLLIIALFIGLIPLVSANNSCYVSSGPCSGDYVNVFNVTDAGHFAEPGYSVNIHRVCCPSIWSEHGFGDEPSFLYSNLGTDSSGNIQGLVQDPNIGNFPYNFTLAENIEGCRVEEVENYDLDDNEFCIFRMNHDDQQGARILGCEDDVNVFTSFAENSFEVDGVDLPVCGDAESINQFCFQVARYDYGEQGDAYSGGGCHRWDEGAADWVTSSDILRNSVCYRSLPSPPTGLDYQYKLVCEAVEICHDSIDNTGDGIVDCASPSCHPSNRNSFTPQLCTNNNQTTADCIANPDHCSDNDGNRFYCSYGINDDPDTGEGYCCPAGQYAQVDPDDGTVSCEDFTVCYAEGDDTLACEFDHNTEFDDWLSSVYDGVDTSSLCVSVAPDYYEPATVDFTRSGACCEIQKYGTEDYYFDEQNVRIFG